MNLKELKKAIDETVERRGNDGSKEEVLIFTHDEETDEVRDFEIVNIGQSMLLGELHIKIKEIDYSKIK